MSVYHNFTFIVFSDCCLIYSTPTAPLPKPPNYAINIVKKSPDIDVDETRPAVFTIYFEPPNPPIFDLKVQKDNENFNFTDSSLYSVESFSSRNDQLQGYVFTIFHAKLSDQGTYTFYVISLYNYSSVDIGLEVLREYVWNYDDALSRLESVWGGKCTILAKKKRPLRLCIKSEHCSYHAISAWSAWSGNWHGGAASRDFAHHCTPKRNQAWFFDIPW